MRVLFDKNVPYGVRRFLPSHQVEKVEEHGWGAIANGALLAAAEQTGFEVFITADQNILYQQNLRNRKFGVVILGSNIWPVVRKYAAAIEREVSAAVPGSFAFIEMPVPPKAESTSR